jgi:ribosomal protein L40E
MKMINHKHSRQEITHIIAVGTYTTIVTKNNTLADTLNPKICPNCNEANTQDAKFCSKCRMIMSYEGYQETLESQKQKEDEITDLKKRQERFEFSLL